jgi:hypothetical protein
MVLVPISLLCFTLKHDALEQGGSVWGFCFPPICSFWARRTDETGGVCLGSWTPFLGDIFIHFPYQSHYPRDETEQGFECEGLEVALSRNIQKPEPRGQLSGVCHWKDTVRGLAFWHYQPDWPRPFPPRCIRVAIRSTPRLWRHPVHLEGVSQHRLLSLTMPNIWWKFQPKPSTEWHYQTVFRT